MTEEPEILFEKRGALGLITLNRPKALNALTHAMCVAMTSKARRMGARCRRCKASSSAARASARSAPAAISARSTNPAKRARRMRWISIATNICSTRRSSDYPKPYIALIHGIVMGGGVGVSVHGSHRVADETAVFAMPETGIGLFPDVGGSYFLPRCPGEIGMYLGLTGARLKTADMLYAGVATHFVPAAKTRNADRTADDRDTLVVVIIGELGENLRCGTAGSASHGYRPLLFGGLGRGDSRALDSDGGRLGGGDGENHPHQIAHELKIAYPPDPRRQRL